MVVGPDYMRAMRTVEADQVDALLRQAFAGDSEARLVRDLRASAQIEMEMVLPWEGEVLGYLALSRLVAPQGWLALAPVAIAPAWQGRGLGARLVAMTMKLVAIKAQSVVVIGKPSFYARAGFSVARATGLRTPYPAHVTGFAGPDNDLPVAEVTYPDAFAQSGA
jgi:putative acetyltransferase